jgi:hypothetical protein
MPLTIFLVLRSTNATTERPYLPASTAMNSPSGEIFTPPNSSNFVKCSSGIGPDAGAAGVCARPTAWTNVLTNAPKKSEK